VNTQIKALLEDLKPLPKGTRIKTNHGTAKRLMDSTIEAANRMPNHLSIYLPFWILGWKDLHEDLLPPESDSILPLTEDEETKLLEFRELGKIPKEGFWEQ